MLLKSDVIKIVYIENEKHEEVFEYNHEFTYADPGRGVRNSEFFFHFCSFFDTQRKVLGLRPPIVNPGSAPVTITAECGYKSDIILKRNLKYTRFFIKEFMFLIGWTIVVFPRLEHIILEEDKEVYVVAT